jgi:hypothetical protein
MRNSHFLHPYALNYQPTDYETNDSYNAYYNYYNINNNFQQFPCQEADYDAPREDVNSFMKIIPERWNADQGLCITGETMKKTTAVGNYIIYLMKNLDLPEISSFKNKYFTKTTTVNPSDSQL